MFLTTVYSTRNPRVDQKWSTLDQIWSTLDQNWSNPKIFFLRFEIWFVCPKFNFSILMKILKEKIQKINFFMHF